MANAILSHELAFELNPELMAKIKQSEKWKESVPWGEVREVKAPNLAGYTREERVRIIEEYEKAEDNLEFQHLILLAQKFSGECFSMNHYSNNVPKLEDLKVKAEASSVYELNLMIRDLAEQIERFEIAQGVLNDAISAENKQKAADDRLVMITRAGGQRHSFPVKDWDEYQKATIEKLDIIAAAKEFYIAARDAVEEKLKVRLAADGKRAKEIIKEANDVVKYAEDVKQKILQANVKCERSGFTDKKAAKKYMELRREYDEAQTRYSLLAIELGRYMQPQDVNPSMPPAPGDLASEHRQFDEKIKYSLGYRV